MRYDDIPRLSNWKADTALLTSGVGGPGARVAALAARFETPAMPQAPSLPPRRDTALVPIDDLVELYEKAWSPMAKRNVLHDLKSALDDWSRAHPGPKPAALEALVEVTDRKSREASPGAGRYTQVYCVGWKVGCNYGTTYFRHSPDDRTDMETKCGEMMQAINAARGAMPPVPRDDPTVLKIFMAPEFFFRGQNGAYSPDVVSDIVGRMRSLGTGSAAWNDWLFVFGTAVAAIEAQVTFCRTCGFGRSKIRQEPDPTGKLKTIQKCSRQGPGPAHDIVTGWGAEVQNVALLQKGSAAHMVVKEYVSGIDYTGNQVTLHPGTAQQKVMPTLPPSGGAGSPIESKFDDERMGGCLLTVDGIRIGLEICLDHSLGQPGAPMTGRAAGPLSANTQVLLIPSFGMKIGTGLYCMDGGIAFNVDGQVGGTSEVRIKGIAPNPVAVSAGVPGARGSLDLWGPFPLP
jgi:hypothetical protein